MGNLATEEPSTSDDSSKIVTIFDTHDSGDAVPTHTKDEVPFIVGDKVILRTRLDTCFTNMQRHYGEHILVESDI